MLTLLKNRALWSYSLAHFSVDLCAGALPVIMVYLARTLNLTIAQTGFVIGAYAISSSLTQPLFGYLSDRTGGRYQSALGLACIAIFQGSLGFAPSYPALVAMACLAGCGSAAFHPHGASGASRSGGARKAAAMSIFMLGGNGGYAIGPVIAAAAMAAMGVHGSVVIGVIGLALIPLVLSAQGQPHVEGRSASQTGGVLPARHFGLFAIVALMAIMFMRAWVQSATTAYIPVYFTQMAQLSVEEASRISSANLFALAAGGLAGGVLADRLGGRRVMIASWLIYALMTLALFTVPGLAVYPVAMLAGFVAGASWPPLIVMAQELFPKNAGVASGIALGFAFAMGGIGTAITGSLAEPDRLGLTTSLIMLAALPLLSALAALALPPDWRAGIQPSSAEKHTATATALRLPKS
ncbi:MAG: MFS transporter [Candidatus Roseilinea sp.]|nr:MAG: MFS transporter [Candidatus Roseilinea sp.]